VARHLLFRADAGPRMGTGHVMRCLALAQAWKEVGGEPVLVTAAPAPSLEHRWHDAGMEVIALGESPGSREDARRTTELAQLRGGGWVVADGYHFGADYQRLIKDKGLKLLVIDDYGHAGQYAADLVLNHNLYAHREIYPHTQPGTRLLLGSRYTLLRREFWGWRDWPRQVPKVAAKLLITLGGGDVGPAAVKILKALQDIPLAPLEVVVATSAQTTQVPEILTLLQEAPWYGRLEQEVDDMPALMAWADVALANGGGTAGEMAYMGLPALLVSLADNQEPVAESLEALGAAVKGGHLAEVDPQDLVRKVARLLQDQDLRTAISRKGRALIDGRGPFRVLREMAGDSLTLRPALPSDSRLIWNWANDPESRRVSFSADPIPWPQHEKWFSARLRQPPCNFYVAVLGEDMDVGMVRFDPKANGDKPAAIISVNLNPHFRGQGLGPRIIRLASRRVLDDSKIAAIHAYIKNDNQASIAAFLKAGFKPAENDDAGNPQAVHQVLEK
jgi:UDP-2,4-diacetamido-2,4,6-trideoxy-beta-L-altropyranose hydrolase